MNLIKKAFGFTAAPGLAMLAASLFQKFALRSTKPE
jgi:hypothetical protein